MKIISTKKPETKPAWWVGAVINHQCGTKFQLEAGDKVTEVAEKCLNGRKWIQGYCPTCNQSFIHYKPERSPVTKRDK